MTILDQPEVAPSPLPLEDLIPEARQLTRRRRLRVSASALATVSLVALAGFAGGAWNAQHPSRSASSTGRAISLAPSCTLMNHLSLTSFHQGSAMSNVFRVVFTNHGRAACSLRGVPTLRFVNGPRHVPEGPSNARVYSDQRVTSLEVPSTASVVATIWSDEPVALASRQCGTWRPETGINLTYGATTFYVSTFPSSPPTAWPTSGACSRRSTFIEYVVGG